MANIAVIPKSCFHHGIHETVKTVSASVSDSDGLKKISEVFVSILDVIMHFHESLTDKLGYLRLQIRKFTDMTTFISLTKRVREWVCPDANGKRIWQQSWPTFLSSVALTVSQSIDLIWLLDTLKFINLGAALQPLIITTSTFLTLSYSFDSWLYTDAAHDYAAKAKTALSRQEKWNSWKEKIKATDTLPQEWHDHIENKIDKCEQRIQELSKAKNETDIDKAKEKKRAWEVLKFDSKDNILKTCAKKAESWSKKAREYGIDKVKSWIYVASSVASAVLTVLSFVQPYLSGAILVTLLLLYVGNNALDLGAYLLDLLWK
jgi:hypothetical protein